MGLNNPFFTRDNIDVQEALYLFDADGAHGMAIVELCEDEWNDNTGLCWDYRVYVWEDSNWEFYDEGRYWDYDDAGAFNSGDFGLPRELDNAKTYIYETWRATEIFERLFDQNCDFTAEDLDRADYIVE